MTRPKKSSKKHSPASSFQSALDFFAEAGLLKKVKRSGWWVAGIQNPESVADHSFRTAVIGYYLAYLEGVDPLQVMAMALFNDIHEARINDLHKMGHYYIDFKDAEKRVFKDQIQDLDSRVQKPLRALRDRYDCQNCPESQVARDADILECLIQAKEYHHAGYAEAEHFFQRAPELLKTKSAQALWREMITWDSSDWWQKVVKFER
ncbi:MAG: HD domain-containing protein [Candidatus Omnitrophica bacterium]|nr:HD domain-containing protein [Candidatus Omnitrophota bacterium]